MNFPNDLKYTKEHEWAKIEGNIAIIGITEHAQSALGDIVYVEVPKKGRELKAGETFGVVESIKAVSDLYAPLAGQVVDSNTALSDDPGQINREPYRCWMVKVEIKDPSSVASLMDAEAYSKYVKALT